MRPIAAILVNAQAVADHAHVVFVGQAFLAMSAAEPRINNPQIAFLHAQAGRIRPQLAHAADDFMPHGQRQFYPAVLQVHGFAAAKVVKTFPDMQVGMADAAMRHLHQHFCPGWLRRWQFDFL